MDLKLVAAIGFWFLVCIQCALGSVANYTRDFSRRGLPAFTVMYQITNPEFYKDIVKFDSCAAFVLASSGLEANRVTRSVKNNEEKQAIVVDLDAAFLSSALNLNYRVSTLLHNFFSSCGMNLKFVLIKQMRPELQNVVNEFERQNVAVITGFNLINSAENVPYILHGVNLVEYEALGMSGAKDFGKCYKRSKTDNYMAMKMEAFLSEYVPVVMRQENVVTQTAAAAPAPMRYTGVSQTSANVAQTAAAAPAPIRYTGVSQTAASAAPQTTSNSAPSLSPARAGSGPFNILFKGLVNYERIPEKYRRNLTLLVSTTEISAHVELFRAALNQGSTLVLQLNADEWASIGGRFARETLEYLVEFTKFHGIDFSFRFMMPPADVNAEDRSIRNFPTPSGVKLVLPRAKLDLHNRIDVFEGAIIVDISENPSKVIRSLDMQLDYSGYSRMALSRFDNYFCASSEPTEAQKTARFRDEIARTVIREAANIELNVRRATILDDSFRHLQFTPVDQLKSRDLNIRFVGEAGIDAGGLRREWYSSMAREIFNPNYALFKSSETDQNVFQPNERSFVNEQHLAFFRFIGKFVGKALIDGVAINCHFSRSFYKHMMGIKPQLHDLREINEDVYRGLCWIADNDVTGVMDDTTFTVDIENFGVRNSIDLKPNGSQITLSEANKFEYIDLMVEYKLKKEIQPQLTAFLEGFHAMVPQALINRFEVAELERLIAGASVIDVDDWQRNTEYSNADLQRSQKVTWFWQAVRSFNQLELRLLLKFATGSPSVPVEGFAFLRNRGEIKKFRICNDYNINPNFDRLPLAHTCFNTIDLPDYLNYADLRAKLLLAINEGNGEFLMC